MTDKKSRLRLYRSTLLVLALVVSGQAGAQRAIPEDTLAAPVLLTVKNAKGILGRASGFYINTERAVYLVTAKHVFTSVMAPDPKTQKLPETDLELLSYSKEQPNPKRVSLTVNLAALGESGAVRVHATDDVAILRLAKNSTLAGAATVELSAAKTFDQALIGNEAIIYGFPVSLGIPQRPQFEADRPLLRKALVAGKNNQSRKIILDGAAYPGNSGGPVFQIERDGAAVRFNLIGVIVAHIPLLRSVVDPQSELAFVMGSNSGYSVAEPMDSVIELINQDISGKAPDLRVSSGAPVQAVKPPNLGPASSNRKAPKKATPVTKTDAKPRRATPANAGRPA